MTNRDAFLTMIAVSELGKALLAESDNGYNVLVGSLPGQPHLFGSYADHPRQLIPIRPGLVSSAAGRYQILSHFFDDYKQQLSLPDFSPASQDAIAVQMIRECEALDDIDTGRIEMAISKCRSRWASLPGAGYGQRENESSFLIAAYQDAGGSVA